MVTAAIIGGVASLGSAVIGSKSASKGIKAQKKAGAQARADLAPYNQAGQNMLSGLSEQATKGLNVPLERAEGFGAIQDSAAAGGKLHSGGTMKGLTSYNNMLNARNNNMIFNQMYDVARLGGNAAAGQATSAGNMANSISDLYTQKGGIQAAGIMGASNAFTQPSFLKYVQDQNVQRGVNEMFEEPGMF